MAEVDEVALYAEDGIGRIGVIVVFENPLDKTLNAKIIIAPERFRVGKKTYEAIDKFIDSHTADVEVRDR